MRLNPFRRKPTSKDPAMADDTNTPTPVSNAAAIDYDRLGKSIAAAVAEQAATINKPVLDALGKLAPTGDAGQPQGAQQAQSQAVTLDQVRELLQEQRQADQTSRQKEAARSSYLSTHAKDLPAAYRDRFPDTGDVAELKAAEATIRDQWRDDLKAAGFDAPDTGGDAAGVRATGGTPPAKAPVDYSKLNPAQKVALGLNQGEAGTGTVSQSGINQAKAEQARVSPTSGTAATTPAGSEPPAK